MTLRAAAGFEYEPEDTVNPIIVSLLDRISGDLGTLVAGLNGSFGALRLTNAAWWQSRQNINMMPSPTTDHFWYTERFNLVAIPDNDDWIYWRFGGFPICYAVGIHGGGVSPDRWALYKGDYTDSFNPTFVLLAEDNRNMGLGEHHINFRLSTVSPYPFEMWVDNLQLFAFAGDAAIVDPFQRRFDYHNFNSSAGKGGGSTTVEHDSFIYNDEAGGAPLNGRLPSSWVVMGHQPFADGSPADWDPFPTNSKVYYCTADFNRFDDPNPGTEDNASWGTPGNEHEIEIVDKNAAGTVYGVMLYAHTSANKDGEDGDLKITGSTEAFTWKNARTFTTAQPVSGQVFPNAPDGAAWTNTKFDQLSLVLKDFAGIAQLGIEAVGPNLAQPAQTPAPVAAGFPHSQVVII